MNKLQSLKCFEVTSQTQANNGTVCYHDPIANCDYLSYENGYIRRAYTREYENTRGLKWKHRNCYQLNPQKKTRWIHTMDGVVYQGYGVERIMVDTHDERMERLSKAVVNYRRYLKKQKAKLEYNH